MEGLEVSVKLKSIKTEVILRKYIDVDNHRYIVDNKKVVLDPSKKELQIALWLSRIFNANVYILPKVLQPEGIKTADYLINNEKWDLKGIKSNKNTAIYTSIRKQERQANNFIFDISRTKVTTKSAIRQIEDLFKHKDFKWFKMAIIKKNNDYVFVKR